LRITYQFAHEEATASDLIGRLSARFQIRDLSVREPEFEVTIRRIYAERLWEKQ
jgi:ABC-type uncharacterized transport system ATPase subunit